MQIALPTQWISLVHHPASAPPCLTTWKMHPPYWTQNRTKGRFLLALCQHGLICFYLQVRQLLELFLNLDSQACVISLGVNNKRCFVCLMRFESERICKCSQTFGSFKLPSRKHFLKIAIVIFLLFEKNRTKIWKWKKMVTKLRMQLKARCSWLAFYCWAQHPQWHEVYPCMWNTAHTVSSGDHDWRFFCLSWNWVAVVFVPHRSLLLFFLTLIWDKEKGTGHFEVHGAVC